MYAHLCASLPNHQLRHLTSLIISLSLTPTHTVAAAPVAAGAGSSEVVSMADDKFSDWMTQGDNAAKWEKSLDDPKSYE